MSNQLKELFAAPKGNLKIVSTVDGNPLYSSEDLKRRYIIAMTKSGRIRPIFKKVKELVKQNKIIPAYTTKSFFKSIVKKQPLNLKGIAGYWSWEQHIVYLLVEETANIFSFTSNDALAILTIHELVHACYTLRKTLFLKLFNDDFKKFYSFYFSKVFSINEKDIKGNNINEIVNFLSRVESKGKCMDNKTLKKYYDLIGKSFMDISSLSTEEFDKMRNELIISIKLIQRLSAFGQGHQVSRVILTFKHIYAPLYTTYKHIFSIDPLKNRDLCYQELFTPSEIISITAISRLPNPKICRIINTL